MTAARLFDRGPSNWRSKTRLHARCAGHMQELARLISPPPNTSAPWPHGPSPTGQKLSMWMRSIHSRPISTILHASCGPKQPVCAVDAVSRAAAALSVMQLCASLGCAGSAQVLAASPFSRPSPGSWIHTSARPDDDASKRPLYCGGGIGIRSCASIPLHFLVFSSPSSRWGNLDGHLSTAQGIQASSCQWPLRASRPKNPGNLCLYAELPGDRGRFSIRRRACTVVTRFQCNESGVPIGYHSR